MKAIDFDYNLNIYDAHIKGAYDILGDFAIIKLDSAGLPADMTATIEHKTFIEYEFDLNQYYPVSIWAVASRLNNSVSLCGGGTGESCELYLPYECDATEDEVKYIFNVADAIGI